MSTTKAMIHATLDGSRIILDAVNDEERASFIGSLPDARWNRQMFKWTCMATPAAAWRIFSREDSACCPAIEEKAEQFAARLRAMTPGEIEQPPVRARDSWQHQVGAYQFARRGDATLLSMAMGTGKSKAAIDIVQNQDAEKTLIICPTSVVRVWPDQFAQHSAASFKVVDLTQKSVALKLKAAEHELHLANLRNERIVLIVNYESAWREPLGTWILDRLWDVVILDESHRIKSHSSAVSKWCGKLHKRAMLRLCLTGTPMATPADVFGQYRFLDPGLFGTSFHRFKDSYARMNPYIPQKVDEWINQEKLAELFGTIAYQVDLADTELQLPEVLHEQRWVDLSRATMTAYDYLEENLIAEIDGGTVTAANGMVNLLRLQQMTSGFIQDDDTKETRVVDHAKAEALREILEDAGEPVVVFCRFRQDLETVRSITESLHLTYGELSGTAKDGLNAEGRMSPDIDVLGVQIQSGGVGIDLTRARIAVYYSVGFDLLNYKQSLARVHRPGQDRPVIYYHLLARNTVDPVVYGSLQQKEDVVNSIINYLKGRA